MEQNDVTIARQRAIDKFLYASRLLSPEVFPEVMKNTGNRDGFIDVCKSAGIPENIAAELFDGLNHGFIKKYQWP